MTSIQNLSISYKFAVVVALAALLPLLGVGLYGVSKGAEALAEGEIADMEYRVGLAAERIDTLLDAAKQDAMFLQGVPPIQGIIRARQAGGTDAEGGSNYNQWTQRLATIFANFGRAKGSYLQLRYLAETGDELVRVDFDDGMPAIIPAERLQNKAGRAYFDDTMKLAPGQVHVSAFNLNRENGKVEIPLKPVVRVGVPVFDAAGQRRGAIILNIRGSQLLRQVADAERATQGGFYLVNSAGYYLYHANPNRTWGFELGRDARLSNDMPGLVAAGLAERDAGVVDDLQGQAVVFKRIVSGSAADLYWILVHAVPRSALLGAAENFKTVLLQLMLLSLAVSVGVGVWLSRRWFVKPLGSLLQVLKAFGKGELSARLSVRSGDEIGQVGRAFNAMAEQQQASQEREAALAERERAQLEELRQAADIRERVEVLLAHVQQVAAGDLSTLIDVHGDDDLARLGHYLNDMTRALADVSRDIYDATEQIADTLNRLSETSREQAATAAQQTRAVSDTTRILDQMKQASGNALEQASALGGSAERTGRESDQGANAVWRAVEDIEGVQADMSSIVETIQGLSKQTSQIEKITHAVNDLANQSRMLALNASIEAAKAGDAGRGFAVVAQEVRDLAGQSQEATGQVQAILKEIRNATELAVTATEQGVQGVEVGASRVRESGELIRRLDQMVKGTVTASEDIVGAVREEAAGVEQVNAAMRDISAAVTQFSEWTRITEEASDGLSEMAERLRARVSVYKL